MRCETVRIADIISEISMGPFGSNIKVECFVDDGIPVLNGSNLEGFALKEDSFRYVTEEKANSLGKANAHRGDIVITHRGTLGQIVFIPQDSIYSRYVISQSQFRVKCNERVLPEYLVYYFHTRIGQHKLLANTSQVGVPALARATSTFQEIELDIPDIDTQKKIVAILEPIRHKIELNKRINDNLEQQARAIFKHWFIDSETGGKTGTFSDLIEAVISGDWGKDSQSGKNSEAVYCIRGADIPEVKTGGKGKMPVRYIPKKNYDAKRLMPGDIVIEISGGSPTQSTGRAAAISQSLLDRYDRDMICTNFCRALKPKAGYSMFTYYYLQYLYSRNIFFVYENGTTGIKNLDLSSFMTYEEIIIPPAELVRKFDDFCQNVFDVIFSNGRMNETLAKIRDSLIPKLISGELDIKNFPSC